MEKHNPFSRPGNANPNELAEIRRIALETDLANLPSTMVYQRESRFTPKWSCEGCGTQGIPCAQGECPICNNPRPREWRDPEQGESESLGSHRVRAGFRPSSQSLPKSY